MKNKENHQITKVIGDIPYKIALAGGWIDQPFISEHNPSPPGSMVVVSIEPEFRFMERAGVSTGTRNIALKLWKDGLPEGDPDELVQQLYMAENEGKSEPSGSQDMIGLIYPGISRIDYDFTHREGIFPVQIESNNDPDTASWLENVINILPIEPRPNGYNPLEIKNLEPEWIARLGDSGKMCYEAIVTHDLEALGKSMNECMLCWEKILPGIVHHHTLKIELMPLLEYYQSKYPGAMYSGCGGGYLYVTSDTPVPGAFHIKVRTLNHEK
jgi:hypothetical protein